MANNFGANDIDAVIFDVETGLDDSGVTVLHGTSSGIMTTAHPFTEADLVDFSESGEHPGLD
ncbi:hypothetical protein HD599_001330 [Conyzicola lurida]|uniref:Uncharacterized protein n=1 Tax=Conyzicola lurida TaxID=1172621 RepID=A0A841AIE7_9MICO|nr:hypothetical protein [Conyzicola lurida]MBB5843007.1 hypothetical protein [Conyzicola lurida]